MGNTHSEQKITKPQGSIIVSVQHKEYANIHDCEELRQLKQLPKTVPLRPSTSYPFQSNPNVPNPASNIGSSALNNNPNRKTSLSDNTNNREIRENDIDSTHKNQFLLTPSIIGTSYSNTSSMKSDITKSDDSVQQPFNPNTLRPPKLPADGMDALYKHLREHFTSLAVKVDCNQVTCTFRIQEMDEQLAITRANMIDIDYTTNQLQKTISSMKILSTQMSVLRKQCHDAVERCNSLWKLLPSTPRSLSVFSKNNFTPQHNNNNNNTTSTGRRIIMEGAMVRLGTYLKGSKKRWVILYIDGLMAYYNPARTELKGVIDLINATEVIPSDISHLMITVKKENNKLRSWHFKCPSPQHVTKWLDAIRSLHFIRARSKLKYCENIPTQFLRDNTCAFMGVGGDRQCVFSMLHLFNVNGFCYQVDVFTYGNVLNLALKGLCCNINIEYIDWNIVRNIFNNDKINDMNEINIKVTFTCDDDIISVKYCNKLSQLFFSSKNVIKCITMSDIINAMNNNDDINDIECKTILDILCKDENNVQCVQRIKTIHDIEIINYGDISVIFICDFNEHCLWCYNLNANIFIKLINTPSPNSITTQNEVLYITSLQCGIYYIALKDIDFHKAFQSPSFFSPFVAKTLTIFENIVLKEIICMKVPPSDLQPLTLHNHNINNINASMLSNISKSSSPRSTSCSSININEKCAANMLFVIDIEYQLYMIRLTDLVLISFGVIENCEKLFYYEKFDNLYITRPSLNKIDCISNIYHEIVSLRSSTNSALFGSNLNSPNTSNISGNFEHEIKENINTNSPPQFQLNSSLQKVNTVNPQKSDSSSTNLTSTKVKNRHKHKHKHKKHLSHADIKALMHKNQQNEEEKNGHNNINEVEKINNKKNKNKTKKICFPKSLYLVYQKTSEKFPEHDMDDEVDGDLMENNNMDDVEMEILVEVDNMLQSYMLSELRQHSKKLLSYTKRNYSFLYLYTSPYDGQSMYRELDNNYESSVPAKNLIQHSSIGPVILVKLKLPTKQQIRKQKEKELKIKKNKNKQKHKKNNVTQTY